MGCLAVLLSQRKTPELRLAQLQAQVTHDLADSLVIYYSPPRTRATCIRRYPYSELFASKSAFIFISSSSRRCAVSLSTCWNWKALRQADRFSPHALRRACATHNYERGVDLVAIQQMLGHWQIGTTMRYVSPSSTFIEDAYRKAVSAVLAELEEPL